MYKLAIVPKIKRSVEYSDAYGSQYDFKHIRKCLKLICSNISIDHQIIYESELFRKYTNYDGVLFVGLSWEAMHFISTTSNIDIYTWSFNQCVLNETPEVFNNTSIIFEQSTLNMAKLTYQSLDIYSLPLAFQLDNSLSYKYHRPKYDLVFNGTLYRNRREDSKYHRVQILELLLKKNISIINYNGRSRKKDEIELLQKLKKYPNFKVKNLFGKSKHYHNGFFSLDLPFLDTDTSAQNEKKYGMSWDELENSIWLNHWDIFRAIGSKCNIITFDSPSIKSLGLSDESVHFYKSSPDNVKQMADEIFEIIKSKEVKIVDLNTWNNNSYLSRWEFIINKIRRKKSIPYLNE